MKNNQPRLWTKDFISISLSNLFLFMAFYFLLVTMPIYVVGELGGKNLEAGLMTTVFLVSAIIIRPFAGRWIEKWGGRTILLFALGLFLGATMLYFFANTIAALLLIRFLHGIGFGIATTATGSTAANIIPGQRRGEGMGYFILSSTFAMVLGPFLGLTVMQKWGVTPMLEIAAASAFAGLLAALFITAGKQKLEEQGAGAAAAPFNLKGLFEAAALPIALTGAFFAIVYSSILSFVSVYANELGLGYVSSYFFVVYAVVLLLSRPFTGKLYDLYGPGVIVYPAIIFFAIGMFILGTANSAQMFLLSAAFAGLGWGTLFPTYQTIAIQAAHPKRSAMATATFLSIFDTGIGLGSFIVGLAAAKMSFSQLYLYSSGYVLLGIAIYYVLHGRKHRGRKQEREALS
ncbi:MFS transporter [Bacillus sp. T33-2]|uniref:MFS transporter n=1 Tax=Bacillus sp. T33-2 TaxID=2054168 RepID=UPI000C778F01|nr:MFS transporter [Bacillus sp. T33-2]PLR94658.1 MFS transporter [Bacillus sp. T33-2]